MSNILKVYQLKINLHNIFCYLFLNVVKCTIDTIYIIQVNFYLYFSLFSPFADIIYTLAIEGQDVGRVAVAGGRRSRGVAFPVLE